MKKNIFIVFFLVCVSSVFAQFSLAGKVSMGVGLVDSELAVKEGMRFDSFKINAGTEFAYTLDFGLMFGLDTSLSIAIGNDQFSDQNQYTLNPLSGLEIKAAPVIGYFFKPYKRPYQFQVLLNPIFVSSDAIIKRFDDEKPSVLLGSGIDLVYLNPAFNKKGSSGVFIGLDVYWKHFLEINHKTTAFDYLGLDICLGYKTTANFR